MQHAQCLFLIPIFPDPEISLSPRSYSDGMAFSHFYGYLKLILPGKLMTFPCLPFQNLTMVLLLFFENICIPSFVLSFAPYFFCAFILLARSFSPFFRSCFPSLFHSNLLFLCILSFALAFTLSLSSCLFFFFFF